MILPRGRCILVLLTVIWAHPGTSSTGLSHVGRLPPAAPPRPSPAGDRPIRRAACGSGRHHNVRQAAPGPEAGKERELAQDNVGDSIAESTSLYSDESGGPAAAEGEGEEATCYLCCEEAEHWAVGACGHRIACAVCGLRMRALLNATECIVCKQSQTYVVVTARTGAFGSMDTGSMILDSSTGMFFDDADVYARMVQLRSFACMKCSAPHSTVDDLQDHLVSAHKVQMCVLCVKHRKAFTREQHLFTAQRCEQVGWLSVVDGSSRERRLFTAQRCEQVGRLSVVDGSSREQRLFTADSCEQVGRLSVVDGSRDAGQKLCRYLRRLPPAVCRTGREQRLFTAQRREQAPSPAGRVSHRP